MCNLLGHRRRIKLTQILDSILLSDVETSKPKLALARSSEVCGALMRIISNHRLTSAVGWDEGVLSVDGGMSLGEKSTLTITG